jgi:thiol:disulfide interchange protein DsbC
MVGAQLIDAKTMKNVTDERMKKLTAIRFGDLPLERAIKQVRGDGKRVLATFEDPNCGYCKRLAKDIAKLENVTVYTFLYPILSEDSVRKSKQIWCSADRARAWNDWIIDGKAPAAKDDCDTAAIARNQEFGRKLNITGTPTMFFADGERVPGAMPLARIEQKLGQQAK